MIEEFKTRILNGGMLNYAEAVALSQTTDTKALCAAADEIRQHFRGDFLEMCTIVNAKSGRCSENCKWCSQSAFHQTDVEEYDLINPKEAELMARENARQGVYRFSLVTSGRAISNKKLEQLCSIYRNIQEQTPIHLCASMGLLNSAQLEKLKQAGVQHYHCNIETAPSYFPQLCSTHSVIEKIATIEAAQALGMKICSGGILGMGESMEQRVEMAFVLQELKVDSIPLNILMPVKGTPLVNAKPLSDEEILISFALFRFINPRADIRLAGGRASLAHLHDQVLHSGISAALVGDYLTTIGTNIAQDKELFSASGFTLDHELIAAQKEKHDE